MASTNPTDNTKPNDNAQQEPTTTGGSSLSEAEKFLESLNLGDAQPNESGNTNTNAPSSTDHKDIMSFLDEISQYPNDEQTEKSKEKAPATTTQAETSSTSHTTGQQQQDSTASGGGWMAWGNSLWNQASEAVKSTTEQLNRSVESPAAKLLEDRVKNLQGYVNKENLGKLGSELRNLTHTILETVAPPISEHELVEVWLSHDMRGYVGLEALVYRAFARVMEQTESGHVVVRKIGDKEDEDQPRNLNLCEGLLEGTKLAKANLEHLVKTHYKEPEARTEYSPQLGAVPVINCPVFLAIQPISMEDQVVFVLLLVDPTHQLNFKTYSQSMPLTWLDIPFEENEWVEDKMVEAIRLSVTTVAQDYVYTRMTGAKNELAKAVAAAASSSSDPEKKQEPSEQKEEKVDQVKNA
ncbi:hypothetical protein BDA99DRAFT_283695 [Phascolomyces articulosus]|uniref:Maintenance of telomere capping protein 1 n=1 Tax=Phascolomyces articulosus TaxID=60185 RepID=A0AAD5PHF2_9FUNG|nr:hypothetical protein BDA99DRAFT_283695 [Phascolomyces articulosus]